LRVELLAHYAEPVKRLLLLFLLVLLAACKPSAQEQAGKFCARVKPASPAAEDRCTQFYVGLRGVAKECIDDCTATAADGDAFEGCRETCMGQSPSVQDVCLGLKRTDLSCVSHYVTMQKSDGKKYGCAARCIARDKNEASCASACGVAAAPAAPPNAMNPMP
jgi:hypothetical protein